MGQNDLPAEVEAVLQTNPPRITRLITPDGRTWWLKRVERLSLRLRLQKGDPARSFEAEREGLKTLAEKGIPVPQIAVEGADFFLLPDAGPTLQRLASKATDHPENRADTLRAFKAAGRALALLHWAGLSHGRPAPRDICWDGETARFIDLERFSQTRRSSFWQALDLVIFTQSCFTRWPEDLTWLDAAMQGYAENAPEGVTNRAARIAFWLAPLKPLARLLRKKPEFRAIPLTLGYLRAHAI